MTYSSYPTTSHKYAYFWAKYRPVLLKLMISAAEGPQQYKFSSHELKSANTAQKGYTFMLKVHKSKAVNNVRECPIANDLLWILQQSAKAVALSAISAYEFRLDKHFVLHVVREVEVVEAEVVKTEPDVEEVVAVKE